MVFELTNKHEIQLIGKSLVREKVITQGSSAVVEFSLESIKNTAPGYEIILSNITSLIIIVMSSIS